MFIYEYVIIRTSYNIFSTLAHLTFSFSSFSIIQRWVFSTLAFLDAGSYSMLGCIRSWVAFDGFQLSVRRHSVRRRSVCWYSVYRLSVRRRSVCPRSVHLSSVPETFCRIKHPESLPNLNYCEAETAVRELQCMEKYMYRNFGEVVGTFQFNTVEE